MPLIGSTSFTYDTPFYDYIWSEGKGKIVFVWKDSLSKPVKNFTRVQQLVQQQNKQLLFAINGGMYTKTSAPLGLYIEKGTTHLPLNTGDGYGNFYLKPNGVFYIDKNNKPFISVTQSITKKQQSKMQYATQSGPMLLIKGEVHPKLNQGSKNVNIRNGVGILPNGQVVFSMSQNPVNFYDFAMHFKKMGCKDALYLDGVISEMFYPAKKLKGNATDKFGAIIAVVK